MIRKGVDKEGNEFTVTTDELRYPLKLVITTGRGNSILHLISPAMDLVKAKVPGVKITLHYVAGKEITLEFEGTDLKRQALRIVTVFVDTFEQWDPATQSA